MTERELRDLTGAVKAGHVSRRAFMRRMGGLGLTAPFASLLLSHAGVAQAATHSDYKPAKAGGGGSLKMLFWQAPTLLNPHFAVGTKDQDASRVFYEPLAGWDSEGNLALVLAAEVPTVENGGLAEDGTSVTWKLKQGVKWHDGQPFTAKDVICTFDLVTGKGEQKLRRNPRQSWYGNVDSVTANGDYEVTVHLKRPQPSILSLLASGYTPVYPCHIPVAQMRTKPIGTGPFKFVEFKQNEGIKSARNADYWKKGKPYRDGIEFTIVPNRATAMLSFVSGKFDITFPWEVTLPLLKDIKTQMPSAVCEVTSMNNSTNLILNRNAPPFETSLFVATAVVSVNAQGYVTTDAGIKAFATDGPKPEIASGAPPGSRYEFFGDEHGRIILPPGAMKPPLGTIIECVTPHDDPTVNLHDVYHVVSGDTPVDIWPVDARGKR